MSTAADAKSVLTDNGGLLTDPARAPKILVDLSTISPQASAGGPRARGRARHDMLVLAVSGNDVVGAPAGSA